MRYDPLVIANYFIEKATENSSYLTPMKLIKLVYFAHAWNLTLCKEPLISEQVEAWKYGPVIPSIYRYFKRFGNEAITELAPTNSAQTCKLREDEITPKILDKVWDVYGNYTAIQLSNMTHEPGSPWRTIYDDLGGEIPSNYPINDDLICAYFSPQECRYHEQR